MKSLKKEALDLSFGDCRMENEEGDDGLNHFGDTFVEQLDDNSSRQESPDDIKILIASDIHVGYGESKATISQDAIATFEEVLQIAIREQVDFVLLGGDLFHQSLPSRDMITKVIRLLRKYCLNSKEVCIQFISDATINFQHSSFDRVNYEDGDLNIGLPVFSIHGNHDDMSGKSLTVLDELHESGLLNLFGKFEECENYEVSPILLRKGNTRLALYGIGSQRDDRLSRAFESSCITFLRPRSETEGWFNILTLHQNRPPRNFARTTGAFLPVKYIPTFFDVVVWGHEHECLIDPQYVEPDGRQKTAEGDGFYIIQPGSTVATSLTPGEAKQKHVSVLTIRGRRFQSRPIPLETTRQIFISTIKMDSVPDGYDLPKSGSRPPAGAPALLDEVMAVDAIREMLKRAENERGPRQPEKPLIRINLIYSGPWQDMHPLPNRRLVNLFGDVVANPEGILSVKKVRDKKAPRIHNNTQRAGEVDRSVSSIEDMISEYYDRALMDEQMTIFTEDALKKAVREFVIDNSTTSTSQTALNAALESALDGQGKLVQDKLFSLFNSRKEKRPYWDERQLTEAVFEDLQSIKRIIHTNTQNLTQTPGPSYNKPRRME